MDDFKECIHFLKLGDYAHIIVKANLSLPLIFEALHNENLQESRCEVTLQNTLIYSAKDSPVPFSFLLNSLAVRMFANLLQEYTCRRSNHFSELRLSRSNLAILCNNDDTITIRLGADFFNSPVTVRTRLYLLYNFRRNIHSSIIENLV
jgi:hypothetical protein